MPFKSEAQRRWMYANEPEMAERWQKKTPKGKKLPEKVASVMFEAFRDELEKIAYAGLAKTTLKTLPKLRGLIKTPKVLGKAHNAPFRSLSHGVSQGVRQPPGGAAARIPGQQGFRGTGFKQRAMKGEPVVARAEQAGAHRAGHISPSQQVYENLERMLQAGKITPAQAARHMGSGRARGQWARTVVTKRPRVQPAAGGGTQAAAPAPMSRPPAGGEAKAAPRSSYGKAKITLNRSGELDWKGLRRVDSGALKAYKGTPLKVDPNSTVIRKGPIPSEATPPPTNTPIMPKGAPAAGAGSTTGAAGESPGVLTGMSNWWKGLTPEKQMLARMGLMGAAGVGIAT